MDYHKNEYNKELEGQLSKFEQENDRLTKSLEMAEKIIDDLKIESSKERRTVRKILADNIRLKEELDSSERKNVELDARNSYLETTHDLIIGLTKMINND